MNRATAAPFCCKYACCAVGVTAMYCATAGLFCCKYDCCAAGLLARY